MRQSKDYHHIGILIQQIAHLVIQMHNEKLEKEVSNSYGKYNEL